MGRSNKLNKAVFFDRDGVLNKNIYYRDTNEWESPRLLKDLKIYKNIYKSLYILQKNNYKIFIVTNQPSYAKGKTTLKNLKLIQKKINNYFKENSIKISKVYCSYKHNDSIFEKYKTPCRYRKPNTGSLVEAKNKYNLDLSKSWIIGDRETDIEFGSKKNLKTIRIINKKENKKIIRTNANFKAKNVEEAVKIIVDFCLK
tara:strand:- start:1855 stop:2454 length:600 start_codon:yes stop_codon:yes gene_type:complete